MAGPLKADLNKIVHEPGADVDVRMRSPKRPEEIAAEISERKNEGIHRRRKDLIVLVAFLVLVGGVAGVCITVVLRTDTTGDDRKWAMALLSSIVSAAASFLAGKGYGKMAE